jgi:hypothetical protein
MRHVLFALLTLIILQGCKKKPPEVSNKTICSLNDLPANLRNGLVAFYPFCGNANDVSGNNNNGVVTGAGLTTDRFGNSNNAYNFNGVTDKITVDDDPSLNPQNISVSIWYQTNDVSKIPQSLLYKSNWDDASNEEYAFEINYGATGVVVGAIKQNSSCQPGANWQKTFTNLSNTQWNHFVYTYDGIAAKIYINGVLVTTNNSITGLMDICPGGVLTVGAGWSGGNGIGVPDYFSGKLDDILIYNRALNASEVQQLFR